MFLEAANAASGDSLVHFTLGVPTLVLLVERLWTVFSTRKNGGNGYAMIDQLVKSSEEQTELLRELVMNSRVEKELRQRGAQR